MKYELCTGTTVIIDFAKGLYDDPRVDTGRRATLDLPTDGELFANALNFVAASPSKPAFICYECLIPDAKEWIDASQDLERVNEFARALSDMERQGVVAEYSVLLGALRCDSLNDAMRLAEDFKEYRRVIESPVPDVMMPPTEM